jgi:4-hydroxy-tetrahydrodipicolinate reductase
MYVLIHGVAGRMGGHMAQIALSGARGITGVCGVDEMGTHPEVTTYHSFEDVPSAPDCIIDFSHHSTVDALLAYAVAERVPVVIATTGFTDDELRHIHEAAAEIPVFLSANMSLGVALLTELTRIAARMMPDAEIEIIEKHHNRKLDAPSGTALMLARAVQDVRPEAELVLGRSGNGKRTKTEIGLHAIRMGNIVGEHEVLIGTDSQTISLKHEAHDRALFAEGAAAAAEFLMGKAPGLYNMQDLVRG